VSKISFIIAEKSYLIRAGLYAVIAEFRGCDVVCEVNDEKDLNQKIAKFRPEIIIVNSELLTQNLELISLFRKKKISTKVIVLQNNSIFVDNHGIINKILEINQDKSVITKTIWEVIKTLNHSVNDKNDELSEREKEIVGQIALGKTNKQVADELFISSHTVVTHRKNIVRKLGIKTVSGLTVYAILNKIITINDVENSN
jgi:DNA-binding NarL/FixJ family response regulator